MILGINFWAVLIATIIVFFFGGLWYSKKLFGAVWANASGMKPSECEGKHSPLIFVGSFLMSLVAGAAFAIFLGPQPPLLLSLAAALVVGICWVATSLGVNYMFSGRGFKLFLIDAGYHIVQFLIYGLVIGLWH